MCWTWFETIGHSIKKLGPSQKTLLSTSVSTWLQTWTFVMCRNTTDHNFVIALTRPRVPHLIAPMSVSTLASGLNKQVP